MALDINGYNPVFNKFVQFAQQKFDANEAKAIAAATVTKPLQGRTILSIGASETDEVHKWTRTNDEFAVNDRTRALFKAAVANMFGGESKIPAAVKKAMLMGDFNAGKPLTARRILAVKAAIDADGTAKARSERIRLETFASPDVKRAALGLGYMKSELPKLARAAHFYAEAKGVSEMEAMNEVGRPGTAANRLMNYGGRFLENAANFQDGLRLIAMFSDWHDGLSAVHDNISGNPPSYAGLDTPSKVNMDIRASQADAKLGLERFIFEDIATNPDFNLAEMDAERAFGVEHNPTSRYMTTAPNVSILGTIANVPPEKRRVIYAAFNAIQTLAQSGPERSQRKDVGIEAFFIARVIRHLPKLESIFARTGTLTGRDVIKTCYPEIRNPGNYDADTLEQWQNDLSEDLGRFPGKENAAITSMMESAGATFEEARKAMERGKTIPQVPYFTTAQYSIVEASSVATAGIKTLEGDICRISPYVTGEGDELRPVFPRERQVWKFDFPDGQHFETGENLHADIPNVERKVKELCGEVHQKQIGTVAFLLSQAGTSALRNQPLAQYGIKTDEHCPVDFSLSRDAATGAVTITCTSPKELPVRFSWTATVAIDGTVTSTPFTITGAVIRDLDAKAAKSMLKDAAAAMGRNLSSRELSNAVEILRRNANGFWPENAKLFAQFLVKLPLGDARKAKSGQKADAFAQEIKQWRSIKLGDKSVSAVADAIKTETNNYISQKMSNADSFGQAGKPGYANIFETMIADAHRLRYVINGESFSPDSPDGPKDRKLGEAVIASFKRAAPAEKAQKAISCLMHQGGIDGFITMSIQAPPNPGTVAKHDLPGGEMFASRNMMTGLFSLPLLDNASMHLTCKLDMSPDGNTATVTIVTDAGLTVGEKNGDLFGHVQFTQQMTVDLRPEVPVVTDVKLAQTIE